MLWQGQMNKELTKNSNSAAKIFMSKMFMKVNSNKVFSMDLEELLMPKGIAMLDFGKQVLVI